MPNRPEMCSEGEWSGNEEGKKLKGISLPDIRSVPFVLILGALRKPNTGGLCTNSCSLVRRNCSLGLSVLIVNGNFSQNMELCQNGLDGKLHRFFPKTVRLMLPRL